MLGGDAKTPREVHMTGEITVSGYGQSYDVDLAELLYHNKLEFKKAVREAVGMGDVNGIDRALV